MSTFANPRTVNPFSNLTKLEETVAGFVADPDRAAGRAGLLALAAQLPEQNGTLALHAHSRVYLGLVRALADTPQTMSLLTTLPHLHQPSLAVALQAALIDPHEKDTSRIQNLRGAAAQNLPPDVVAQVAKSDYERFNKYRHKAERVGAIQAWEFLGVNPYSPTVLAPSDRTPLPPAAPQVALPLREVGRENRALASAVFVHLDRREVAEAAQALAEAFQQSPGLATAQIRLVQLVLRGAMRSSRLQDRSEVAQALLPYAKEFDAKAQVELGEVCRKAQMYEQAIAVVEGLFQHPESGRRAILCAGFAMLDLRRSDINQYHHWDLQLRELLEGHKIGRSHQEYARFQCLRVFAGILTHESEEAQDVAQLLAHVATKAESKNLARLARGALDMLNRGRS